MRSTNNIRIKALVKALSSLKSIIRGDPFFAILYLTYRCNSRCRYCDIYNRNMVDNPITNWILVLNQLYSAGVRFVSFTGGEPLLYREVEKILAHANHLGFHTTVITNGINFSSIYNKLNNYIDDLIFSLSTIDREEYKKERGIDAVEKVKEAILLAKSNRFDPTVLATVDNENIFQIEPLARWCLSHDIVLVIGPVYEYFNNSELEKDYLKYIEYILKKYPNTWMNKAFLEFLKSGGNHIQNSRCKAGSIVVIDPEFNLLLPCFHRRITSLSILEDSRGVDFKTKWNMSIDIRKQAGKYSFCNGCKILCYFEGGFLFPLSIYTILDISSRLSWLYKQWKFKR